MRIFANDPMMVINPFSPNNFELKESFMPPHSMKELFENSFKRRPDKPAITFFSHADRKTALTYGQLDLDANRLAHAFRESGVAKGDRVIFFIEKSLLAAVAHIALQKLGAVSVPLNPGFRKSEMEYLLKDADAALVLTETEKKALITEIDPRQKTLAVSTRTPYQDLGFFKSSSASSPRVEIRSEDPALIVYTSGTTGKPKGAVLTQRNLINDVLNIVAVWEITSGDVLCHSLPLFHVHGLCFALHSALVAGSHTFMVDQFKPAAVLQFLSSKDPEAKCTMFMGIPTMYSKMMDELGARQLDFSHLRLLTSGSAPLLVGEFERIRKMFGKEPVEREGMSETGMNFSNPLNGERKPGSIGLPLPDLKVRIVDPQTFKDVAPGQTGEIWLKSPSVSPGYWRKPEETKEAFVDGWFRTGDLGRQDDQGYYFITDRIKHIIISGGENVSAKEVETVINTVDGVVESAVVGVPDEKWGELVVAAVSSRPEAGLTSEQIQAHCAQHLHKWKCPKRVVFVGEIPKNTMGKILKEEVKKLFLD
jgi:malonyl-CoA/methylmalonyl-CoA synthetase